MKKSIQKYIGWWGKYIKLQIKIKASSYSKREQFNLNRQVSTDLKLNNHTDGERSSMAPDAKDDLSQRIQFTHLREIYQ